jgi:hypothetical protein
MNPPVVAWRIRATLIDGTPVDYYELAHSANEAVELFNAECKRTDKTAMMIAVTCGVQRK